MESTTTQGYAEQIEKLKPWFHNLHLPDGSQTAPDHFLGDFPAYKWQELAPVLPQDLHGWHALDIGCNAGYYSIELARRGAEVTAIDMNAHYLKQAEWAAGIFNLQQQIHLRRMQVYDLIRENVRYDLVLFLGVFYHLRYPLLALDMVAQLTGRLMVFQTLTMPGMDVYETKDKHFDIGQREVFLKPGWPKMAFIEHRFVNDPTNWWAANHAAVEAMLRSSGFKIIKRPGTEVYLCEPEEREDSLREFWQEQFVSAAGLPK
ncbi:MAG: TIGR04290 family methyltransferase [Calditrichia bacterium]